MASMQALSVGLGLGGEQSASMPHPGSAATSIFGAQSAVEHAALSSAAEQRVVAHAAEASAPLPARAHRSPAEMLRSATEQLDASAAHMMSETRRSRRSAIGSSAGHDNEGDSLALVCVGRNHKRPMARRVGGVVQIKGIQSSLPQVVRRQRAPTHSDALRRPDETIKTKMLYATSVLAIAGAATAQQTCETLKDAFQSNQCAHAAAPSLSLSVALARARHRPSSETGYTMMTPVWGWPPHRGAM